MERSGPVITTEWLQWMSDYRDAAVKLADMESFDQPEGEIETLFVKFALFARVVTLFDTAVLLAERDKLFDLRSSCRKVVECALGPGQAQHNLDGSTTFSLDPLLTEVELHETLSMLGLSVMICTLNIIRMIPTMNGGSVFYTLNEHFVPSRPSGLGLQISLNCGRLGR